MIFADFEIYGDNIWLYIWAIYWKLKYIESSKVGFFGENILKYCKKGVLKTLLFPLF
jgi:hypothetical protein